MNAQYEFDLNDLIDELRDKGLPDPQLLTFYQMRQHRRIWIDLCIDTAVLNYVRMIHLWNKEDKGIPAEERKPIYIMLENFGGDTDFMWMLIDAINTSKTPVYTVNLGVCASAAAIIFISGKKRFMMPHASVVVHEGHAQMSGDAVKVLDASDVYRKELKQTRDYILEKTNIPASTLKSKKNNDWTMDAAYCLEHNVCDVVVTDIDEVI